MQQTSCRGDIAGGISPHYQNRSMLLLCSPIKSHPWMLRKLKAWDIISTRSIAKTGCGVEAFWGR